MAGKPHIRFSLRLHGDAVGSRAIRALVVLVACAGTFVLGRPGTRTSQVDRVRDLDAAMGPRGLAEDQAGANTRRERAGCARQRNPGARLGGRRNAAARGQKMQQNNSEGSCRKYPISVETTSRKTGSPNGRARCFEVVRQWAALPDVSVTAWIGSSGSALGWVRDSAAPH